MKHVLHTLITALFCPSLNHPALSPHSQSFGRGPRHTSNGNSSNSDDSNDDSDNDYDRMFLLAFVTQVTPSHLTNKDTAFLSLLKSLPIQPYPVDLRILRICSTSVCS